jgi:SAM-dependent methyltransferase
VKHLPGTIPLEKDAFGASMMDFHFKRGDSSLIIERDDRLLEVEKLGNAMYFAPFKRWQDEEKKAAALVKGRVLDVGCGAGRWCLEMQRRGLKVTGIDNSPLAVELCRLRGVKDVRLLSLREAGRLKPRLFDSVVMMGHNFGLFGGLRQARQCLKQLDLVTPARARIYGHTFDPYQTENPLHLAYQRNNRRKNRLGGQIRFRTRYKNMIGPWFDYLFAPVPEIRQILQGTGWQLERTLEGRARGFVAVIKKLPR